MGSLFIDSGKSIKVNRLNTPIPIPMYLQFVPGIVVDVVTGSESKRAIQMGEKGKATVNTIIAKPHMSSYTGENKRKSELSENNRYIPLLRGMVDVPTKGDPVLLATFGGSNFYLGPLNTNNNPNFNGDEIDMPVYDPIDVPTNVKDSLSRRSGTSRNFQKVNHGRMEKGFNRGLDHPISGSDVAYKEIHGDMMFEGRHGNSVRIGSRNVNPYIYISNGRDPFNHRETLGDGSLISITSQGSLTQHFGGLDYFELFERDLTLFPPLEEGETIQGFMDSDRVGTQDGNQVQTNRFRFASDNIINRNRSIFNSYKLINQDVNTTDDWYREDSPRTKSGLYAYGYGVAGANQILLHSDRVILNSKRDDMFLSSFKDIYIGAQQNLAISTTYDVIIDSRNTYLGKDSVENGEQMVLGNKLVELMKDLFEVLKQANGLCQGAPVPLVDVSSKPLTSKITTLEQKLDGILSKFHFIEQNKNPDGTNKRILKK